MGIYPFKGSAKKPRSIVGRGLKDKARLKPFKKRQKWSYSLPTTFVKVVGQDSVFDLYLFLWKKMVFNLCFDRRGSFPILFSTHDPYLFHMWYQNS